MSNHPKYEIDPRNGCVRCDHSSSYSHREPDSVAEIALPKELVELELNPIDEALVEDPCNPRNYLVLRFDRMREYEVLNPITQVLSDL